jgi:hypothetical protein
MPSGARPDGQAIPKGGLKVRPSTSPLSLVEESEIELPLPRGFQRQGAIAAEPVLGFQDTPSQLGESNLVVDLVRSDKSLGFGIRGQSIRGKIRQTDRPVRQVRYLRQLVESRAYLHQMKPISAYEELVDRVWIQGEELEILGLKRPDH